MESCLSKNIYVYYGSEHFNRDLLKKITIKIYQNSV